MLKKENLAVLVTWPTHRLKITLKLFSRQHQHQQKLIGSWIFGQYLGNTDSITLSLSDHKADGGKCWQSIPTPPFTQLSEWVAPNTLTRLQCQRKYSSSLNYFLKEYFSSKYFFICSLPQLRLPCCGQEMTQHLPAAESARGNFCIEHRLSRRAEEDNEGGGKLKNGNL